MKTKKDIKMVSLISIIILLILGFAILHMLYSIKNIQEIEIPLLYIVGRISKGFSYAYGIVILIAMLTSAVSAGFGFMGNVSKTRNIQFRFLFILCVLAIVFGEFGFSNLVGILYPIFGYLGIIQMFFILTS